MRWRGCRCHQGAPPVLHQRVHEDPPDGSPLGVLPILPSDTGCLTQMDPVRRLIARSPPRRRDEGLYQHRGITKAPPPVAAQAVHGQCEGVARQVRHPHPRQDQKTAVGHDPVAEALPLQRCPPQPGIPHGDVPGRRRKQEAPQDYRLARDLTADPVTLVGAKGALETHRVMGGHGGIPHGLLLLRHRLHRDRPHLSQRGCDLPCRQRLRPQTGPTIRPVRALRRQAHHPCGGQLLQQLQTGVYLQLPVRRLPRQILADRLGQFRQAQTRKTLGCPADQFQVRSAWGCGPFPLALAARP